MPESPTIPADLVDDIDLAVRILKRGGCQGVFLFGSVARGEPGAESDLDFAVEGCPPGSFYRLFGQLMWELRRPVDLVDLDSATGFATYLRSHGELVRLG